MPDDAALPPDLSRQRDRSRRSLLRANTAVAFILLLVLVLAAVATLASLRARQNQRKAEEAQAEARSELWRAYLSDIRAIRQDKTLGRRPAAMEAIRRATSIAASPELRNEAVAALALPDFQKEASFPLDTSLYPYAFDSDLTRCAFGLTNGDVVVQAMSDHRELARLRMADGGIPADQEVAATIDFSPDGTKLSVRYRRGALAVWDWQSGKTLFHHDIDQPRRRASRARFSLDGKFLIGPIATPNDTIGMFEVETGRLLKQFLELDSFRHVSMRPGHPMFAANTRSNVVVINWETGLRVAEFPVPAAALSLAWSPNGRKLAIAGSFLEVYVWDIDSRERRVLAGHKNDVWSVIFDPSGDRLATASHDGTSRLWDLRDGRLIGVTAEGAIRHWKSNDRLVLETFSDSVDVRRLIPSPVFTKLVGPPNVSSGRTMDVSPDGNWAVSIAGRDEFQVWNLSGSGGGPQTIVSEWLRSLSFHPSEPRLLITKRGGPESRTYLVVTNNTQPSFLLGDPVPLPSPRNKQVNLVTSSADGRFTAFVELASGRGWAGLSDSTNFILQDGLLHNSLSDYGGSVRGSGSVSLSPDGRWLACGVSRGGLKIFDPTTGKLAHSVLPGREANVQFSLDGRWLIAREREACRMLRVSDWSQVWEHELPRVEQPTAAFSPDAAIVAVATSPKAIALFESATGRELAQLTSPDPAPIITMRWSADGRRLVCATRENHVEVWEPAMLRKELKSLGLDWDTAAPGLAAISPVSTLAGLDAGPTRIALGIFATAAAIAFIAVLSLHRHRKLIESYAQTEALALERGHELRVEREVGQLKDSFVSMVSHEFRTPLAVIQSSAQILGRYLERLPPEERRQQVESITKNVRRMSGLIEEVLLLGKMEGGHMRCRPAPLDLAAFCRRVTDEMLSATHAQCPIQLDVADVPEASADENLLRHITSNLLSNAVKYSPAGKPVRFSLVREGNRAVFTIRDEGLGIPAADCEKLFTAFHRGRNVASISGTGLGLTIVKRCVEMHDGEITFESHEGKGTTFTVRLPLFEPPN